MDLLKAQLQKLRTMWAAQPTLGERFTVPREGKDGVQTILYRPVSDEKALPTIFNMHGGAWLGGDAVFMETFCQLLANELPAVVVNVNYTKADIQTMPYQQEEIADAVRYFAAHADDYGMDADRFVVGGHSAGAHLACCVAVMMAMEGFHLAAQMLVYPVADLSLKVPGVEELRELLLPNGGYERPNVSPALAPIEILEKAAPALFILCGKDDLLESGKIYANRLIDAGVAVKVKQYKKAEHGFLEVNQPDYKTEDFRKSPEQEAYARDCERYLIRELRPLLYF